MGVGAGASALVVRVVVLGAIFLAAAVVAGFFFGGIFRKSFLKGFVQLIIRI